MAAASNGKVRSIDTANAWRLSYLLRKNAEMQSEISEFPEMANPLWAGTVGIRDIKPGLEILVIGFGDDLMVRHIEVVGHIRHFNYERLFVDTKTGSLELVASGIAPDGDGKYVDGFIAFFYTGKGFKYAEDFLYHTEKLEDEGGQLIYPNVSEVIELLVKQLHLKRLAQVIKNSYTEDPRSQNDLLL